MKGKSCAYVLMLLMLAMTLPAAADSAKSRFRAEVLRIMPIAVGNESFQGRFGVQ